MATDELTSVVAAAIARRGIDPARVAGGAPVLDPRGNVMDYDELVAWRAEQVREALRHQADGQFDLARLPAMHDYVQQWVQAQKGEPGSAPTLLLRGTTGCGKTTQCFCALREMAMHHAATSPAAPYAWYFVTHRNFAAQVRPGGGEDPEAVMERYMDAHLLCLDDLGDYHATDWAVDCTARLVNYRDHHGLATIYSSNLPFTRGPKLIEAEQRLGQRIATLSDTLDGRVISRLKGGWIATLPEIDYRMGRGRVLGGQVAG